jgi:hypothetical protein
MNKQEEGKMKIRNKVGGGEKKKRKREKKQIRKETVQDLRFL